MAGTNDYNGNDPSSSHTQLWSKSGTQIRKLWAPLACSTSSSIAVNPSTSCASSSLPVTNSVKEDINEVLGGKFEEQEIPFYKQPDQYQGLIHKIREFLKEQEPELELSKQLLHRLKTKAEQFLPNVPTRQSIASLMTMTEVPSYYSPSLPESSSLPSIDPNVQAVIDTLEPVELPAKSLKDTICEICQENFASAQSKLRHAKRKHADQMDKVVSKYAQSCLPFSCPTCQKSFANSTVLRSHQRRHDEDQLRFPCPNCPKRYILGSELRKHIKKSHESLTSGAVKKRGKKSKDTVAEDMPEIV